MADNGDVWMVLTELQRRERGALTGDPRDVLCVVSGLREYRKLVAGLLAGDNLSTFHRIHLEESVKGIEGSSEE